MKTRTRTVKPPNKSKKLPQEFVPPFPYIEEVSTKEDGAKKKKIKPNRLDKVTVNGILKLIAKRKKVTRWKLVDRVVTRAVIGRRWFCPITFYCYIKTGQFFDCEEILEVDEAARKCGVTGTDMMLRASDGNTSDKKDWALRRKLLQATGLSEQAWKNREKIRPHAS